MATYQLRVRYSETGAEGFCYHGNYYNWFDMVQEAFLREHGLSYSQISEAGVHFLPIEVKSKYFSPAYFGEELEVSMQVEAVSNVKTTLSYTVKKIGDNALVVKSTISYACMSKEFRPLIFKQVLPELYRALCDELPVRDR